LIGGAQNACRPFNERVTGGQTCFAKPHWR
jgi:hypothetical protein